MLLLTFVAEVFCSYESWQGTNLVTQRLALTFDINNYHSVTFLFSWHLSNFHFQVVLQILPHQSHCAIYPSPDT